MMQLSFDFEPRLRKKDWVVLPVSHSDAANFVREHHYAKGCPRTSVFRHGLFRRGSNTLMGVVVWLPPTKPAAQSVNKFQWRKVLSLSRMVVLPGCPKNSCSFLLSASIKLIKKDGRFVSLVTYADDRLGHNGHVYKSSNWLYVGKMRGSPSWIDPRTGAQVSVKSTVSRTKSEMIALGYKNIGCFSKHKYVLHLKGAPCEQ